LSTCRPQRLLLLLLLWAKVSTWCFLLSLHRWELHRSQQLIKQQVCQQVGIHTGYERCCLLLQLRVLLLLLLLPQ
jgi:hypothetical protein